MDDVLAYGAGDTGPTRFSRWKVAASIAALLIGIGAVIWLRGGADPGTIVEDFGAAYVGGDCDEAADAFHFAEPEDRASALTICRQAAEAIKLTGFDVTGVDESPPGLAVPAGASDVAGVHFAARALVDGRTETFEDTFVVAKYDGEWKIVFERFRD